MMIRAMRHLFTAALGLALASGLHAETGGETHSAYWWDPADSGWGLYTFDQGNLLAPYWITYDESGKPTWFMGLTEPQADGSYTGKLYRYTGTPFAQISRRRAGNPGAEVGQVKLEFDADPRAMKFTHTLDGHTSTRTVTRFNFNGKDVACQAGNTSRAESTNYSDMWWEPVSSGWDLNIMHLDQNLYAQWHTYEAPNRAVYMTLGLTRQTDGSYTGKVYRQNDGGRPYKSGGNMSAQPGGREVGSATLRFIDGEHAAFDWTIGEKQGHHTIQRLQAGTTANHCAVTDYPDTDPVPPADGELCMPAYALNDNRTLRDTGTSDGTATAPFVFTETITEAASFNGQSGFRMTYTSATYAGDGTYAYSYVGNGSETTASFGAEALDPATKQLLSTSKNDPMRVELTRRFQQDETIALDYGVNSTSAAGNTRTDMKTTYRLIGRESVTVPAGTFSACKIETTVDLRSSTAGISTHVQRSGLLWSDATFGLIKQQSQGTSTVNAFGFTITTELTDKQELLEATMQGGHRP